MSDPGKNEPLPVSDVVPLNTPTARIDKICDAFEKAWRAGTPPRIEDVMAGTDPSDRSRLFDELLEIEIDFLQRGGAEPKPDDYRTRYPDRAEQVAAVFQRSAKTRRLGDYELLEELGHGGMGVVYRARQTFLRQIVALKVLPQHCLGDPQAVARFRREMQLIGGLDHPNIVRALNAGESGGVHFLVMEFVDGVNLQTLVSSDTPPGGPLTVGAACEIVRQAALGLQHAHEHQMVHRDVKPGNIMVNRAGVVKLLDLGLAKFLVEQADEPPADKLTQVGVAMGTVDFMAPEQWENPSEVDIRSDIYSLGCTFFFLLAGKPPYGGPSYDTSRKKLMAHVVAPVPSLADECAQRASDFPVELQDLFERMMAKEPANRFPAPGEVAEALADFADAEELPALVASYRPSPRETPTKHPPTAVANDTEKKQHSPSSRRALSRQRAERRRRLLFGAVVVPVTVAIVVAATWFAAMRWGRRPQPGGDNQQAAAGDAKNKATSRRALAADLASLPGLNGAWWFDEMPWYLPFVRQAVAERIAKSSDSDLAALLGQNPHTYLEPNVAAVRDWLWDVTGRCREKLLPPEAQLLDDMRAVSDSGDRGPQLAAALAGALDRFEAQGVAKMSPADRHALALLQHELSVLKNDRALAAEAKTNYAAAVSDYAKTASTTPSATQLGLLCRADEALFTSRVLADFKKAKALYEEVLANPGAVASHPLPPLFRIDTLVAYGTEIAAWARTSKDFEDILFDYAKKVLEASDTVPRGHPLAAHIDERYAWSLMDQWKVGEAADRFQAAFIIRSANYLEKNPFAAPYIFIDRCGTGLTARYRGNPEGASRTIHTSIDEAKAARDEIERQAPFPGQQRLLRDLHDRMPIAQERWADCELFGGAASGLAVNLAQACELYESARQATADPGYGRLLTCKLAIVRCLHGETAVARKLLADLDRHSGDVLGADNGRTALMRQAADAVLKLKETGPAEGHKALRAFLDQFRLNPSYRDTARRETLELQLFCADVLLSSELGLRGARRPQKDLQKDLKYLDPLLGRFEGRRDMRPFLRRFYELATRACDQTDLVQIAQYVLDSRMVPQQSGLPLKQVTRVIFQFTSQENFAIFLPQDDRPGQRFDLDLRRKQIQEAAAHGKPLHLDDELVRLMNGELAAGRHLEVSWSDATSWPSQDHSALTDNQWPFDGQIKLSALKIF